MDTLSFAHSHSSSAMNTRTKLDVDISMLMDTSQDFEPPSDGVVTWVASQSPNPALQALMKEAEREKRSEYHPRVAYGRVDWTDDTVQPDRRRRFTSPCHGHTPSHPRPRPPRCPPPSRLRGNLVVVTTRSMLLVFFRCPVVARLRPWHLLHQSPLYQGAQNLCPPHSESPLPHQLHR